MSNPDHSPDTYRVQTTSKLEAAWNDVVHNTLSGFLLVSGIFAVAAALPVVVANSTPLAGPASISPALVQLFALLSIVAAGTGVVKHLHSWRHAPDSATTTSETPTDQ